MTDDLGETLPLDKLNALRLGRLLVAEVKASRPGCRAWVEIRPILTEADAAAQREGWTRSDAGRAFQLAHREFVTEHLDGWDYDTGSSEIKQALARDEAELVRRLQTWSVPSERLAYPWNTDYPA
ncbi:hypothetical protein GCM10009733_019200 [Nonomuraea maheshkhaliensis]|uniref:Uncharacterized protein n=1 Tax=Nonomuraea maheshkhaliensis TaxID=419590 RepID=A0ABN2EYU5_9ACTN